MNIKELREWLNKLPKDFDTYVLEVSEDIGRYVEGIELKESVLKFKGAEIVSFDIVIK